MLLGKCKIYIFLSACRDFSMSLFYGLINLLCIFSPPFFKAQKKTHERTQHKIILRCWKVNFFVGICYHRGLVCLANVTYIEYIYHLQNALVGMRENGKKTERRSTQKLVILYFICSGNYQNNGGIKAEVSRYWELMTLKLNKNWNE